ncbi:MAG: hypothetical protein MUF49_32725, partial [Oculatellaceae cyanobacterium Prado106]|nr:hypothetical protein [Oculatellaceae cyanobacterium Prado106]
MPLSAGSIAFVGFNSDGNDDLAFVALVDIPVGEVVYFEDNEWNGTGFTDTNENGFSWTVTEAVAAGTIVRINNIFNAAAAGGVSASTGAIAYLASRGSNRGIGNSDEVIYAYQGSPGTPTVFLTAVANGGFGANGSLVGTGLAVGTTALDLGALDDDLDIAAYVGSRTGQANFSDYLSVINNPTAATWQFQDASNDQSADGTPPDVPFSATAFTTGVTPPRPTVTLSVSSNMGSE